MKVHHARSRSKSSTKSPLKWWQWILMYPALGVAIIGAIPTVVQGIQSFMVGTSWGNVQVALHTASLFNKNWKCLQKSGTVVQLQDNTKIEAAVCDNGDIWIRAQADNQSGFSWVTPEDVLRKTQTGMLMTPAYGAALQSLAQNERKPLCVFRDKSGRIIRKVLVSPGHCQDEQIDQYTGRVTVLPASCVCPPGAEK